MKKIIVGIVAVVVLSLLTMMNHQTPEAQLLGYKQIDYACLNKCTHQGYSYGYCQYLCSYDNEL